MSLALAALALAAAPIVALWLEYGSPAPDTPGQHALLVSGSNLTGWADQPRLGAYEYALHFVSNFLAGWKPLLSERTPLQSFMLLLPSITVAFALVSVTVLSRELFRSKRADPEALLAVAGAAAVAATFLVHVAFSYRRHLETGWMMDAYPRYYLPLVFVIPLATMMFVRSMAAPRARRAVASFLVGAPMLFGLFG